MASISWRLVKQLEPGAVCLRALCNISVTKEAGSASWANISGLAACLRLHNPLSYYCCCYINQMLHIIKQQPEHGQAKLLILWAGLSPRGGILGGESVPRVYIWTTMGLVKPTDHQNLTCCLTPGQWTPWPPGKSTSASWATGRVWGCSRCARGWRGYGPSPWLSVWVETQKHKWRPSAGKERLSSHTQHENSTLKGKRLRPRGENPRLEHISTQPEYGGIPDILRPQSFPVNKLIADTVLKGAVETRSTAVSV